MKTSSIAYPKIAILIAARNEEQNIIRCLQAISVLDYPSHLLEVWIGDDDSTDDTSDLVAHFIQNKPNFFLKHITENRGSARGKANVLAHLAHKATADFFCFTDADVIVPSSWLKGLYTIYQEKIGIITGVTMIKGQTLFAKLQSIDWLHALSLIKLASDIGQPVTAMGNNLFISKKAYFSVGGYENIPFSVTEDFELFKQVLQKGWKVKQLFNQQVLAETHPMSNWSSLLQQRKRWMVGAMQVPWYVRALLALQVIFYPLLIVLFLLSPLTGLILWSAKLAIQSAWIAIHLIKLKQGQLLPYLVFYECYFAFISISSAVYNCLPIAVEWKGRIYHQ